MKAYLDFLDHSEDRAIPLSALVELTNACNVDCEHCYLDLVPDHRIGALSTEEWRRIFRELAAEGCLFLTLSGGEILVRRDWYELAHYARTLGFALRLFTNGTLVDEAIARQMASLEPLAVEVSLHGATAATQDAITRRAGSFDRTLRGIRLLRAHEVVVALKCVLMRRNAHEYDALRTLAAQLGAEMRFDVEVTPKNDGSRGPVDLGMNASQFAQLVARVSLDQGACAQARAFDRQARLDRTPCAAGRRTCHIGPTGDLSPCTQWTTPIGNLRMQSFRDLWLGHPLLHRIRATRTRDLIGCRDCELLQVCNPCMALSLLEHGNLDGPSPTKCRTAVARAAGCGVHGRPAGPLEPRRGEGLVQLRVNRAYKTV